MARIISFAVLLLALVCLAQAGNEVYQLTVTGANGNLNLACSAGPVLPKSARLLPLVSASFATGSTNRQTTVRLAKVLGGFGFGPAGGGK